MACASTPDNARYGPDYDLSTVPRYTPEKPPQCPYEEVGMLEYARRSSPGQGAAGLEQARQTRKMWQKNLRADLNEYDADALMRARAGHLLLIRFTDRDCLE